MSVLIQTSIGEFSVQVCLLRIEIFYLTYVFQGSFVVDLSTDLAPKESLNFIKLCKAKYFTFAPFYNVQKDYFVQFGDPLYPISVKGSSAWGLADSNFDSFKVTQNKQTHSEKGIVSLIVDKRSDNQLYATSLISITLSETNERRILKNQVPFGRVTEGFELLDKINGAILSEDHRPLQDIRIHHTYILEDPFDDIDGMKISPSTPEPSKEQLSTVLLDDLQNIDISQNIGQTDEELRLKKLSEANAKALTLEIIGDLPSAEAVPMENVLFICKLNSITKDEDLKIIFSRFGKITSCEILKDKETGDSLQYGFIEYEDKKSCEMAYFKMDGVLIDDKRIHVDFSQSVSRLADEWRGKRINERVQGNNHYKNNSITDRKPSEGNLAEDKRRRAQSDKRYYNALSDQRHKEQPKRRHP